jgi:hypothetical protein
MNYGHNYTDLWASHSQAAAGPLEIPNTAPLFGPAAPAVGARERVSVVTVGISSAAAFTIGDGTNAPASFAATTVVSLPVRRVVERPAGATATIPDIVLGGAGPFSLVILAMTHPDG